LLIILVIILIIFGAGKLPEIGSALGRGIKNFKKATREPNEIDVTPPPEKEPSGKDNFGCKTQGEKPVEGGMSRKRFTYPRVL
jgi:sec-independent protein translocase protein TatA